MTFSMYSIARVPGEVGVGGDYHSWSTSHRSSWALSTSDRLLYTLESFCFAFVIYCFRFGFSAVPCT